MLGHLLEAVFDGIAAWATEYAPRPVRIGCTALLLAMVSGLLGWALWPWK